MAFIPPEAQKLQETAPLSSTSKKFSPPELQKTQENKKPVLEVSTFVPPEINESSSFDVETGTQSATAQPNASGVSLIENKLRGLKQEFDRGLLLAKQLPVTGDILTAQTKVSMAAHRVGQSIAEFGGKVGMPVTGVIGGGIVSMLPDTLLMTAGGGTGLKAAPQMSSTGRQILKEVQAASKVENAYAAEITAAREAAAKALPYSYAGTEEKAVMTTQEMIRSFKKASKLETKIGELDAQLTTFKQSEGALVPFSKTEQALKTELDELKQLRSALVEGRATPLVNEKALERALTVSSNITKLETKFNASRAANLQKYEEKLISGLKEAEAQMYELGVTTEDFAKGRIKVALKQNTKVVKLPELVVEAEKIAKITPKGAIIEKTLHDAIKATPDFTPRMSKTEPTNFIIDKLDQASDGAFRRDFYQPLQRAVLKQVDKTQEISSRMTALQTNLKLTAEDSVPLRQYIEGKIKAPIGKEVAYETAKVEIGKIYDDVLTYWNSYLTKRGLKPVVRREDYVTHVREMNTWKDLFAGDLTQASDEMLKIQRHAPKVGFEKRRTFAIPDDMLAGTFEAMDVYANKVVRQVEMGDFAAKARNLQALARTQNKPSMSQFFSSLADRISGESVYKSMEYLSKSSGGFLDKSLQAAANQLNGFFASNVVFQNTGAWISQYLSTIPTSLYLGPGRAISAAVKGTATQLADTRAFSWMWQKTATNKMMWDFAEQHSTVLKFVEQEVQADVGKLMKIIDIPFLGKVKHDPLLIEKAAKEGFEFFNMSMYRGTFNQAFQAAKAQGATFDDAVRFADQIVERTQAIYRDVFRPQVISSSSAGGRYTFPFSTYVFNQFSVLKNDLFKRLPVKQWAPALGQTWATGMVMNAGINLMTGRDVWQPGADMIPGLRLLEMGPGAVLNAPKAVYNVASGVLQANPSQIMKGVKDLSLFSPVAIGGLQLTKTVQGVSAILEGEAGPSAIIFGKPSK